jgi:hypothetical protein
MASKLKKVPTTPIKVGNIDAARAAAERAFSNAWGTHLPRATRRARSRNAAEVKAIRKSFNEE